MRLPTSARFSSSSESEEDECRLLAFLPAPRATLLIQFIPSRTNIFPLVTGCGFAPLYASISLLGVALKTVFQIRICPDLILLGLKDTDPLVFQPKLNLLKS